MKHLIIIGLILTILTMGIASAEEGISDGNLTETDYAISDNEDMVLSVDDMDCNDTPSIGEDVIVSDNEREDAIEISIWGYDKYSKTWRTTSLDDKESFGMIEAPTDATGNISIFVEDMLCFKKDIRELYSSTYSLYRYIGPQDLDFNFSPGAYHITITYDGDENYLPTYNSNIIKIIESSDDYDYNHDEVYIFEHGYAALDGEDYFADIWWIGSDPTGNITIFVNGIQCFKKDISECPKDYYGDYDEYDYCIGPQDLDYEFLPGKYLIKIIYDGDEHHFQTSKTFIVILVGDDYEEDEEDEDRKNGVYIEIDGYDFEDGRDFIELEEYDTFARIYATENATGNITVFMNGIQCFKKDISECQFWWDDDWDDWDDDWDDWDILDLADDNDDNDDYDDYDDNNWYYVIGPQDLDYEFPPGRYLIKITYDGDENYSPTSETGIIRLVDENYNRFGKDAVEIVYGYDNYTELNYNNYFASIYAPKNATGNIIIFVNGTQCFKNDISESYSSITTYKELICNFGPYDIDYEFSPGKYHVKIIYTGNEYYSPTFESKIIDMTYREDKPAEENNSDNSNASNGKTSIIPVDSNSTSVQVSNPIPSSVSVYSPPKNNIKLTLKKVNVKKSAKKIVLQATLKINGKAKKGLKVIFKFNGKKYIAKTNAKGIAKVTIKKIMFKKLKVGKKVKIQASYGTTTKKLSVKVKK